MMQMTLYIDPGTGSMLFTVLIGAATTLFFLAKAVMLKLKVFISGKKSGAHKDASYKPYVIYSEGSQYWNTFKPITDEAERRALDVTFYTSSKDDPAFSEGYTHVKVEYIGEGNAAFARLNMLTAGVVLMTTPGLDVYQLKRSRGVKYYIHILHMPNDATSYRLFGLDFFDAVLLTGDYQKDDIRLLEKQRDIEKKDLVTVGSTYLDVLKEKMALLKDEENHPFTVLVSPSWGDVGVLKRYGSKLLDPLSATGWRIIIRPHPQSKKSEAAMLNSLENRYKDNKNIVWDYERDNIVSLKKADIMISDFSGIVFDYTFLRDKPVMYAASDIDLRPYDAYDTGHEMWQFKTLSKMGIKLEEKDFENIKEVIESASDSPALKAARDEAHKTAWMYEGEAGVRTVDYLEEVLERLEKEAESISA